MVKIEVDGNTAVVHGLEWECSNPVYKQAFENLTKWWVGPDGPSGADPHPDLHVAMFITELLHGKVLEFTPTTTEDVDTNGGQLEEVGNPYHEPSGSSKGGQFAHKPGVPDFKTVGEVESWAVEHLKLEKANLSGLSVEDATVVIKSLYEENNLSPLGFTHITTKDSSGTEVMRLDASAKHPGLIIDGVELTTFNPNRKTWEKAIGEEDALAEKFTVLRDKRKKGDYYYELLDNDVKRHSDKAQNMRQQQQSGKTYRQGFAHDEALTRSDAIGIMTRHEVGHRRFFQLPQNDHDSLWDHYDRKPTLPTEYSRDSAPEWFAENYALYRHGLTHLMDKKAYDVIRRYW